MMMYKDMCVLQLRVKNQNNYYFRMKGDKKCENINNILTKLHKILYKISGYITHANRRL